MRKTRATAIFAATAVPTVALAGASLFSACSAKQLPPPGAVMVAIDTNLKVPDDIDAIGISAQLETGSKTWTNQQILLAPNGPAIFPATYAIVRGTDEPIHVRIVGFKNGLPLAIREAITTIPADRTALLRMDIDWLDKGTVTPMNPTIAQAKDVTSLGSTCDGGTSVSGTCRPFNFDELDQSAHGELPTFIPGTLAQSDSPNGTLNVTDCFASSVSLKPTLASDGTTCSFTSPTDPTKINVALHLAAGHDGWCDPNRCLIPLSMDAETGWSVGPDGQVHLPTAVCTNKKIIDLAVAPTSATCATKTRSVPALQIYPDASTTNPPPADAGVTTEMDATLMNMPDATPPPDDAEPIADAAPEAAVDAAPDTMVHSITTTAPLVAFAVDPNAGTNPRVYIVTQASGNNPALQALDDSLEKVGAAYTFTATFGPTVPAMAAYYPALAVGANGGNLVFDLAHLANTPAAFGTGAGCTGFDMSQTSTARRLVGTGCSDSGAFLWADFAGSGAALGAPASITQTTGSTYSSVAYDYAAQMYTFGLVQGYYATGMFLGTFSETDAAAPFPMATQLSKSAGYEAPVPNIAFVGDKTVAYIFAPGAQENDVNNRVYAIRSDVTVSVNLTTASAFASDASAGPGSLVGTATRALWLSNGQMYSATLVDAGVVDAGSGTPLAVPGAGSIRSMSYVGGQLYWADGSHVYRQNASYLP